MFSYAKRRGINPKKLEKREQNEEEGKEVEEEESEGGRGGLGEDEGSKRLENWTIPQSKYDRAGKRLDGIRRREDGISGFVRDYV